MASVIFSGNNVKALLPGIQLGTNATIWSGNIDPSATAFSGNAGDVYLSTLTNSAYIKQDSGSSTNWTIVLSNITFGAVGSTPNADGGSVSGSTITLQPADGTHPGALTSTTQTIGGSKTFSSSVNATAPINSTSQLTVGVSGAPSGSIVDTNDTSKSTTINADPGNVGASTTMVFAVDGTTALTLDSNQRATFAGSGTGVTVNNNLQVNGVISVGTAPLANVGIYFSEAINQAGTNYGIDVAPIYGPLGTTFYSGRFANTYAASTTATNDYGIRIYATNISASPTPTITSHASLSIDAFSGATNNTELLLGTSTIPTGNYGIYQSDNNANYLTGALTSASSLVGTNIDSSGDVTGNAVNITAASNTTLTSLANLVTVGTIGTGVWAGTVVAAGHGGTGSTTVPTSGQITVGNAGGTAYAPQTLSGDATLASTGAITLAAVNANIGSFGGASSVPSFTVNGKGLITAASSTAVVAPAGTLSGTTLNSTVVSSSLTSVGTIGTGVWAGTAIAAANGGTGGTSAAAGFNNLNPMTTTGDTIYESGTNTAARLGIGTTGQVLTVASGIPAWSTPNGFNYLATSNTSVYGGTNSTLSFTGADNTVIGSGAGATLNNSAADNVLLGYQAGNLATSATQSVFIGSQAAYNATTTGTNNIAIGYRAGKALTSGHDNTLIGATAGTALVTGIQNIIIGSAPSNNFTGSTTSGNGSILIGYNADHTNTLTTDVNVIVVGSALMTGAGGNGSNVLIGYSTLSYGSNNTVVGTTAEAGNSGSNTANNTTVMGYNANATKGTGMVAIGYGTTVSGSSANTTGQSVGIGASTSVTGNYSIVVGYAGSDGGAANTISLGQCEPASTSHTGCFLVGETSNVSLVATTTAANQICFGTSGTNAIPLSAMFLGRGAVGDGTATNVSIQPSPMVGANLAGATMTITGGNSTGTGAGGSIIFKTAPAAGGSSSTANTQTTALTISSAQASTFNGLLSVNTTGSNRQIILQPTDVASMGIQYLNKASSGFYNWFAGAQLSTNNRFEITASSATDGTTFSTPLLYLDNSGNTTFAGQITTETISSNLNPILIPGAPTNANNAITIGNGSNSTVVFGSERSSGIPFIAYNAQYASQADSWKASAAGDASTLLDIGNQSNTAAVGGLTLYSASAGTSQASKATFWGTSIFAVDGSGNTTVLGTFTANTNTVKASIITPTLSAGTPQSVSLFSSVNGTIQTLANNATATYAIPSFGSIGSFVNVSCPTNDASALYYMSAAGALTKIVGDTTTGTFTFVVSSSNLVLTNTTGGTAGFHVSFYQ